MARKEISRDELVGCWKRLDSGGYWELREDGTARHKLTGRGASCDITCISWTHVAPNELVIDLKFSEVQVEGTASVDDVHDVYQVKYFDGKLLELWHVQHNKNIVEDVMLTQPVCWKKSRPPKSWQNDASA